jgi:hypothetical protein
MLPILQNAPDFKESDLHGSRLYFFDNSRNRKKLYEII